MTSPDFWLCLFAFAELLEATILFCHLIVKPPLPVGGILDCLLEPFIPFGVVLTHRVILFGESALIVKISRD